MGRNLRRHGQGQSVIMKRLGAWFGVAGLAVFVGYHFLSTGNFLLQLMHLGVK